MEKSQYSEQQLQRIITLNNQMSKIRELGPLLSFILEEVVNLTGAEQGYVILVESHSEQTYQIRSKVQETGNNLLEDTISRSILFDVIGQNKSLVIRNALVNPDYSSALSVVQLRLRSVICVPLHNKAHSMGAIYLENRTVASKFSSNDLPLLELFAYQASIAIVNAKLNESLVESNEELARIGQQKSELIQLIAHELRTPITSMSLALDLFRRSHKPLYLDRLENVLKAMAYNVELVVTISQMLSDQLRLAPAELSVAQLITQIERDLAPHLYNRRQTLFLDLPDKLPVFVGDYKKLHLALENILSNAIKFTPDGGEIHIQIHVSDKALTFEIHDQGIGIPLDEQKSIFEPFYVLGNVNNHSSGRFSYLSQGLGIGLPLVKAIVELHNGQITLFSKGYDRGSFPGTTCTVTLPL